MKSCLIGKGCCWQNKKAILAPKLWPARLASLRLKWQMVASSSSINVLNV